MNVGNQVRVGKGERKKLNPIRVNIEGERTNDVEKKRGRKEARES